MSDHANNEYGRLYYKGIDFEEFAREVWPQEFAYCVEFGAKGFPQESRIFKSLDDARAFYEAVTCTRYDGHEKTLYDFEIATGVSYEQYAHEESR